MALDYKPIDVDNHYYEPLDAFTRHLTRSSNAAACRCSATAATPRPSSATG